MDCKYKDDKDKFLNSLLVMDFASEGLIGVSHRCYIRNGGFNSYVYDDKRDSFFIFKLNVITRCPNPRDLILKVEHPCFEDIVEKINSYECDLGRDVYERARLRIKDAKTAVNSCRGMFLPLKWDGKNLDPYNTYFELKKNQKAMSEH